MPLYDFKCLTCKIVLELKDTALPSCPDCGETMARIWDAPAVKFKGSGFYSTGGQMTHNEYTFVYAKKKSFGIGFDISKYFITFDLGFWYIGLEY